VLGEGGDGVKCAMTLRAWADNERLVRDAVDTVVSSGAKGLRSLRRDRLSAFPEARGEKSGTGRR
jgi:hypothetical protein